MLYPLSYGGNMKGMRELTYRPVECQATGRNATEGSKIMEWSLVLTARSIRHKVLHEPDGAKILVPSDLQKIAEEEICLYEEENVSGCKVEHAELSLKPEGHETSIWAIVVLTAVLGLALRAEWMPGLMAMGKGSAIDIQNGDWWRIITSLTLHADPSHLLGNMVVGGLVILWLTELIGPGPAWLLALLSGALGNTANALLKDQPFVSIGASSAVFGTIGVITGSQIILRRGTKAILVSVGAGLALLAMLGSGGERTDLGAHFFGFASGVVFGLPAGWMARRFGNLPRWIHGVLIAITLGIVIVAWIVAYDVSPFSLELQQGTSDWPKGLDG